MQTKLDLRINELTNWDRDFLLSFPYMVLYKTKRKGKDRDPFYIYSVDRQKMTIFLYDYTRKHIHHKGTVGIDRFFCHQRFFELMPKGTIITFMEKKSFTNWLREFNIDKEWILMSINPSHSKVHICQQ